MIQLRPADLTPGSKTFLTAHLTLFLLYCSQMWMPEITPLSPQTPIELSVHLSCQESSLMTVT